MYDRINPPDTPIEWCKCQNCGSKVVEYELQQVWLSIEDSEDWCKTCTDNHAKIHPILHPESWAIGSTDNENNLTIK